MEDDHDGPADAADGQRPDSLLPYDDWTETALRQVLIRALKYAAEHGLPGEHHFYITFRTDHVHTVLPNRLRSQYPQEMTIVLQHQFWNLVIDEEASVVTVGLSFGGVPSTLKLPFGAITAFADPHVQFGLRFRPDMDVAPEPPAESEVEAITPPADEAPQVVSLDAFRRRPPPKS